LPFRTALRTELLARATAVVGLLAVAVVHILDLHDTLGETPLIGYGSSSQSPRSPQPPS
jgi:hypothetical protein